MIDQLSTLTILMTRHNPQTHKSVLSIAHTLFFQLSEKWGYISPLSIQSVIDEIILEASINHPQNKEPIKDCKRSNDYINGLEHTKIYLNEN
jgi:glycogen debranching enzyme